MSEVLVYGAGSTAINEVNNGNFVRYVRDLRELKRRLLTEDFSLILIDLDHRERHGLEACDFIRQIPRQCLTPIVILSSTAQYESEAFHRIHCYDYLIKPIKATDMLKLVSLCMQRMSVKTNDEMIVFHSGPNRYPVDKNDIFFIEIVGRSACVYTKERTLKIPYLVLDDFLGQYGALFTKIHRSIAVNKSYVTKINVSEGTLELSDGHTLGIGRRYLTSVRKEFDEVSIRRYTKRKANGG